jgi:hypothetical protein
MSSGCKQNWKLLVLIVLLKNRSCKRIRIEFGVSNYLARKAKKLVKQEIILTSADPNRIIPEEPSTTRVGPYC